VLVALALIGLVMVVIFQTHLLSLKAIEATRSYSFLLWGGREILTSTLSEENLRVEEEEGILEENFPWERKVEEEEGIKKVEIVVKDRENHRINLETFWISWY